MAVALALVTAPTAAASTPVAVDFTGGSWNGAAGYPLDAEGGTGVSGAVADLGNGLTVTVSYSEVGTAEAQGRIGSSLGNLNLLAAGAVADLENPGTPLPGDCLSTTDILGNVGTPANGCHETSGLTLNIGSIGANNAGTLGNYVRYDFAFNELVTIPAGVTLTDIDSFRVQYNDAFPIDYQVDLYQDAVGFELWSGAPAEPGTGVAPVVALGGDLTSSSLGGVSYVHTADAPVGGRGGLTDSGDIDNHATFSAATAVRGFSIYYWDELADSAFDPGVFPTVGIENFEVVPAASQLAVTKTVTGGAEPWEFVVTVTGSDASSREVVLTDEAPTVVIDVDPGVTYTVSEQGAPGYALESIDCGDGTDSFRALYDDGTTAAETACEVTNAVVAPTETPTEDPEPMETPTMPLPIAPQTGGAGD
ncbi:hypothetical protein [Microbacterium paraoxydans]|uniref:hypothetical protein n=1 Tax=Microbacterium paraoxydans TaxID=199592 RepID=UPI001CFB0082|nr:hypothetical protein [Microbacterium paraoxydans]